MILICCFFKMKDALQAFESVKDRVFKRAFTFIAALRRNGMVFLFHFSFPKINNFSIVLESNSDKPAAGAVNLLSTYLDGVLSNADDSAARASIVDSKSKKKTKCFSLCYKKTNRN